MLEEPPRDSHLSLALADRDLTSQHCRRARAQGTLHVVEFPGYHLHCRLTVLTMHHRNIGSSQGFDGQRSMRGHDHLATAAFGALLQVTQQVMQAMWFETVFHLVNQYYLAFSEGLLLNRQ